ncbi:putative SCAN domain-containing protein SCAND2P [Parus major]|uniref:putative SCAN domain-containing protein SCAND2P n=1 Tax=Parus major TaxID=9157 RepID=UPI001443FD4D|nr:putative SCAN domain-containing protein SCAND2P [Parus major]
MCSCVMLRGSSCALNLLFGMTAFDRNTRIIRPSKKLQPCLGDPACICRVPVSAPCAGRWGTCAPRAARLSAMAQPVPLAALTARQRPLLSPASAPRPFRASPRSGAGPSAFPSRLQGRTQAGTRPSAHGAEPRRPGGVWLCYRRAPLGTAVPVPVPALPALPPPLRPLRARARALPSPGAAARGRTSGSSAGTGTHRAALLRRTCCRIRPF